MRKTFHATKQTALAIALSVLALAPIALGLSTPAVAASCVPAGGTGLTTFMVAVSHQTIAGANINANGCDIGIYVGPGTQHVTINGVQITGANDHAIFVQDAQYVVIENSRIAGNGAGGTGSHSCNYISSPCIAEDKAVQLVGTSHSVIENNIVRNNAADGGVGIADDGPASAGGDPSAPVASANAPYRAQDDVIQGNLITNNWSGCEIVIAGYDAGVGVNNIQVTGNKVTGVPPLPFSTPNPGPYGGPGSYYGQIVVANDGPFSPLFNVAVTYNTVRGSLLPGIVIHANAFGGKMYNMQIVGNIISQNGYYPPFFESSFPNGPSTNAPEFAAGSTGISVVAEVGVWTPACPTCTPDPAISHTTISSNSVFSDRNAVWLCGTTHTTISNLLGTIKTITECPAGGS
jgi:hypothetical protein